MDYVWYITPEQYEAAAKNGIDRGTLDNRVRQQGWDIERAITQPKQKRSFKMTKELVEKAAKNGIKRRTLYTRIWRGMDPEEAATKPLKTQEEMIDHIRVYDPNLVKIALKTGMSYDTYRKRIKKGMDPIEAATTRPMTRAEAGSVKKKRSG